MADRIDRKSRLSDATADRVDKKRSGALESPNSNTSNFAMDSSLSLNGPTSFENLVVGNQVSGNGQMTININPKTLYSLLLKSLKFPEMNKRRNGIVDPEDATFERIFKSYDNTINDANDEISDNSKYMGDMESLKNYKSIQTIYSLRQDIEDIWEIRQIDRVWKDFIDWLGSGGSLFWIQGKPGSGKSTLIKYIINHEDTQRVLNKWLAKAQILWHFFWKVGSIFEKNGNGLYCSLIYQLIEDDEALAEIILNEFPSTKKKRYIDDWSSRELERVLLFILKHQTGRPLCIFIDGLDEYSGDDGLEGIVERIRRLVRFKQVKLCVASRAEPRLREELNGTPNLKLESLTSLDMKIHIQKKFGKFEKKGKISPRTLATISSTLVKKAEGVFLWLCLAMRSVQSGIQNKDSEDMLILRLQELPGDLETLYAEMWARMNDSQNVYREKAAMFFQFVIAWQELKDKTSQPNIEPSGLLDLGCFTYPEMQEELLNLSNNIDEQQIVDFNERMKSEIRTRCAGLLEIREQAVQGNKYHGYPSIFKEVSFVHRTAHDFLLGTESGNGILGFGKVSKTGMLVSMIKCLLCRSRVAEKLAERFEIRKVLQLLEAAWQVQTDNHDWTGRVRDLLDMTKFFYEEDIIDDGSKNRLPRRPFLSHMNITDHPMLLNAVAPWIATADVSLATGVLRGLDWNYRERPLKFARQLISRGANAGAISTNVRSDYGFLFALRTTALWNLLTHFMSRRYVSDWAVSAVESMVPSASPTMGTWGLVAPFAVHSSGGIDIPAISSGLPVVLHRNSNYILPVFEATTSFLLQQILHRCSHPPNPELQKLFTEAINPVFCLRFVCIREQLDRWFRVINPQPLESIIAMAASGIPDPLSVDYDRDEIIEWHSTVIRLASDRNILEPVEFQDVLTLKSEQQLGYIRLEDAGYSWSEELEQLEIIGPKTTNDTTYLSQTYDQYLRKIQVD